MNLYETVKGRVTPQMAAERYDLPVNRSGMACCPFHNDRTPSMKLYVQAALPQRECRCARHSFLFAKKKQKAGAQNNGVTARYPIFE